MPYLPAHYFPQAPLLSLRIAGFKPVQRLTNTTRNKRLTLTNKLLTQLGHTYLSGHQFRRNHLFLQYTRSTISLQRIFNFKSHYTYTTDYTVLPPYNTATLLLHYIIVLCTYHFTPQFTSE